MRDDKKYLLKDKKLYCVLSAALAANLWSGIPLHAPIANAAGLEESKVLDLKFEDTIEDSSQNRVTGTIYGEETYVTGKVGQALQLSGSDNYIDLGTSSVLQPPNLTLSFWVKPETTLSGEHMIMWNKPDGVWNGEGWYLSILSDDIPLKLSTGSAVQESYVAGDRSAFFPVGEWTHIAVTYDSASRNVAMYRNGIAQEVLYTTKGGGIAANDTDHKYLGFNSPLYGGGYAKLALDEFKIYSEAVTENNVRDIYTGEGGILDSQKIAASDLADISLPTVTRENINLPQFGKNGSVITWESSNPGVLSSAGVVTAPDADTEVILHMILTYGDVTLTRNFTVKVKTSLTISDLAPIKQFDMEQVDLTDPYYVNAFNKDVEYLLTLEPDRLLSGFRTVAGLSKKAELYGGWEGGWSYLRGHSLGHYMSALAQAYKQTKNNNPSVNAQLKAKLDYIISELKACQEAGSNGNIFATPEEHFDVVEGKVEGPSWVPWYTMHKIIAGLVDVYKFEGNEEALQIASKLGDWTYNRTQTWDDAIHTRVLNIEYGGMNDGLYELYKLTNNPSHLIAAHMFDEDSLFTPLVNGQDILENKHANTQIPKIIGALNRYRTLGEDEAAFYLQTAESFWEMVVNDHTYVTGGNSENEHFRKPGQLDSNRDNINDETCNAYNMLKLSRELFRITGDVKYANYYERTLINEIMSSINPETGMTTYFKPMGTGYFKVFSTEFDSFWCDTGTGMENFTKLDDSLYYHTDNDLYVNLYLSSTLSWSEKGLQLTQAADLPQSDKAVFTIQAAPAESINLKFRSPDWIAEGEKITATINGVSVEVEAADGYLDINRIWTAGDTVELTFPLEVQVSSLQDNPEAVAFTYGPVVLSAGMGTEQMVVVPHLAAQKASMPEGVNIKDYILLDNGTVEAWISNIKDNLVKTEGKLEFTLRNTDEDDQLKFTPYYQLYQERYGIYFYLTALDSETFQSNIFNKKYAAKKANATLDEVQVTNDQHELAHNLQGNSSGGSFGNYQYRHAFGANTGEGWLSYDMTVDPSLTNYVSAKYYSGDQGRTFNIYVDGTLIKEETVEAKDPVQFYDVRYEIPAGLVQGKSKVTVKFANRGNSYVGGIFNTVSIMKDYDNNPQLQRVTVNGGTAVLAGSDFTVEVPQNEVEAKVNFTPANPNALVYIDDILIDDTVDRKIVLDGETANLGIKVIAEDGVTEKTYTLNIKRQSEVTVVPLQSASITGGTFLKVNAEGSLSATMAPSNASNPSYQWEAEGAIGIIGDSTGSTVKIKALAAGTGILKLTAAAGGVEKKAETSITVTRSSNQSNGQDSGTVSGNTPSGNETQNTAGVLINGKSSDLGTAVINERDGQSVTTVTLGVKTGLTAQPEGFRVTVPATIGSGGLIVQLNGELLKSLINKQAVLELKTERGDFIVPAKLLDLSAVSVAAGSDAAPEDILFQLEISVSPAAMVQLAETAAAAGSFKVLTPPINFSLTASYKEKIISLAGFNSYAEQRIELPEGVAPEQVSTGIVIEPDGTVRHVPTSVVQTDDKSYAKISSLTGGAYAIINNSIEFKDVSNHWAKDAVNEMASRLIINGTGSGLFSPDTRVTRAEFAAILVRGLGLKAESGESAFMDVKASDWNNAAILTAQSCKLIDGFGDGTFRPDDNITREQAMAILAKAMKITGLDEKLVRTSTEEALHSYADGPDVSDWAKDSIADCLNADIISGKSETKLAPKDYTTRAEAAWIVRQLLLKSDLI